jgi:hypothetical protein
MKIRLLVISLALLALVPAIYVSTDRNVGASQLYAEPEPKEPPTAHPDGPRDPPEPPRLR